LGKSFARRNTQSTYNKYLQKVLFHTLDFNLGEYRRFKTDGFIVTRARQHLCHNYLFCYNYLIIN
ncbi:MAG TPA: hypothetical protein VF610_06405, partial [Segetibacter sp.]